ncbi:MAG: EAL domain-containing protein [Hyphomonadaceae bacterium]|nr:EAL domain-containing protein [Hyphomonadaceae bacterium]
MAAVLTAFALVLGAAFALLQQQEARTSAKQEVEAYVGIIARNAGPRIHDAPRLTRYLEIAEGWREIQRTAIVAPDGTVIAAVGAAESPAERRLIEAVRARGDVVSIAGEGVAIAAAPILSDGRPVAYLIAHQRTHPLYAQGATQIAIFIAIAAAFLVAAVALTLIFVRRTVAPLAQLIAFAERTSTHGRGERIDIKTGDEFEALAAAFNRMMARLDESMRRVQRLAYVDAATNLPNGEKFARELNAFTARADANGPTGAVIVIDFARLTRLLETLGQDASHDLMARVAERLRAAVRTVDRVVRTQSFQEKPTFIARLRQHEFALIAPSFPSPSNVVRYAQMLTSAINQPFEWRDLKLNLDARCGAAIIAHDGGDAETLTRNARLALHAAKDAPGAVKMFTSALDRDVEDRIALEHEMRAAIERNEFRAYFQPKVNLADGRIEGCEALARWIRPDRTIVSPAVFIPLAEETGLISQVADAIMREACWKAAAWAREGIGVQVAVNVSALQFRDEAFPDHVLKILDQAGLPAFCLELELTESIAMENPDQALRLIEPLRERGVRFSIDDFGCGHSSLAALTRLPFDVLKIDQQFVRGLERDRHAPAIIETILAMAATLDMQVVAEGIEQEREAQFLRRRGCLIGQGFLYGAAEPAEAFAERLRAQHRAAAPVRGKSDAA